MLYLWGYWWYRRETNVANRAYIRRKTKEQLGRVYVASSRRQKCFDIFLKQRTMWLPAKLIQNDLHKIADCISLQGSIVVRCLRLSNIGSVVRTKAFRFVAPRIGADSVMKLDKGEIHLHFWSGIVSQYLLSLIIYFFALMYLCMYIYVYCTYRYSIWRRSVCER